MFWRLAAGYCRQVSANAALAAADTLPRTATARCPASRHPLQRIATGFAAKRDTLIRAATKGGEKKSDRMTKVIPACTDEKGGCELTHPNGADA
jgi:hypothetical protein